MLQQSVKANANAYPTRRRQKGTKAYKYIPLLVISSLSVAKLFFYPSQEKEIHNPPIKAPLPVIPLLPTVKEGDKVIFNNINNIHINDYDLAVRHYCISKIRQKHETTIGGFIRSFSAGKASQNSGQEALLLDPAYHPNLGDTLLTLGTERFLHDLGLADTPQCLYTNSQLMKKQLPKCSATMMTSKTIALWHAGGNWGDLYTMPQHKRLPSIGQLLQHNVTVIGMPQSLYYKKEQNAWNDAKKLKGYVGTQKDKVILTWREQTSYDQALKLYPFVQNRLVPDIAFQLGPFAPIRTTPELQVDLLFLLRRDKESVVSADKKQELQQLLQSQGLTYRMVDWEDRLELLDDTKKNHLNVETGIQLLSLGKVVIVDRLHATILSYLTGLPFVYVDQTSQKLTKSLSTAFTAADATICMDGSEAQWARAANLQEAVTKAVGMLETLQ
jgi:pyruvyl transferase EpsO